MVEAIGEPGIGGAFAYVSPVSVQVVFAIAYTPRLFGLGSVTNSLSLTALAPLVIPVTEKRRYPR